MTVPTEAPSTVAVIWLPEKVSPIVCQVFRPRAAWLPDRSVVRTPPLLFFAIDHAPVSAIRSW